MTEIRRGTGRLDPNTPLPAPKPGQAVRTGPLPPAPPRREPGADQASTGELTRDPLRGTGRLSLTDIAIPEAPDAPAAAAPAAPARPAPPRPAPPRSAPPAPPAEQPGGVRRFFGGLLDGASKVVHATTETVAGAVHGVANAVGGAANHSLDALADLAGDALEALGAEEAGRTVREVGDKLGDKAGELAAEGLNGAAGAIDSAGDLAAGVLHQGGLLAGQGVDGVFHEACENLLGPVVPAYENQLPGALGEITNRLDPGQAAFVEIKATVALPSSTVAGLLSFGAGSAVVPDIEGSARAAASLTRNADGKLVLALDFETEAAATWKKGFEFNGALHLGKRSLGVSGGASVEAGVHASSMARVELTFDPNNPADAARLQAILNPSGEGANPASFALNTGSALQDAMRHNNPAVTIGAEAGFRLQANAHVEALDHKIEADLGVAGSAGISHTMRADGSRTTTINLAASGNASIALPLDTTLSREGDIRETLELSTGPDGALTELAATTTMSRKTAIELGLVGESEVAEEASTQVAVRTSLTPAGIAAIRERIAAGESPITAFKAIKDDPAMVRRERSVTTTNAYRWGASAELVIPTGKVELGLELRVGETTTRTLDGGPPRTPDLWSTREARRPAGG